MKTIVRLSFLFVLFCGPLCALRAVERNALQGILITASNQPGQTDRRLADYEVTLRRILRFESYKFVGQAAAPIMSTPDDIRLVLGNGHQLAVQVERADQSAIHVRVQWNANGRNLMDTGLVLRPGVPAVLGGPATGNKGEVYAVILVGNYTER